MPRYDHRRLRALRDQAGLTQEAVAAAIGRSLSTYARYESGRVVPTVDAVAAIAVVVARPVGDLFDEDDPTDYVASLSAEIRALVDRMPPFTPDQSARLRVLLRGVA